MEKSSTVLVDQYFSLVYTYQMSADQKDFRKTFWVQALAADPKYIEGTCFCAVRMCVSTENVRAGAAGVQRGSWRALVHQYGPLCLHKAQAKKRRIAHCVHVRSHTCTH